ncbi:MAG: PAS domain-containing protein, partial [archaeon]
MYYIIFAALGLIVAFFLLIKLKNENKQLEINLSKENRKLKTEKKRLKLTIENIQEGIFITDKTGLIIDANKSALKTLNTTISKITGTKIQNLIHLKEGSNSLDFINAFNITIEKKESFSLSDLKLQIPNSSIVKDIDDSLSPIIDEHGEVVGTIMTFKDVTEALKLKKERANLEQKVDQLERIEVLGDFLTGIAHNFGNIISNINGQIEMIKIELDDKDKFHKRFSKIDDKIDESKQLIKKLSVFNTNLDFEKTPVNINNLVESNKASLLKIISAQTDIQVDLKSEKTAKIDLVDFDRLFLTVLSYLKKNLATDSFI